MGERVTFADLLKKAEEKKKTAATPKLEIISAASEKIFTPTSPTVPTPPTTGTVDTDASHATARTVVTAPTPPTPHNNKKNLPTAPERDFARVANSIVRDALPQGLFVGKSKQLYDFLYLQTRGAIQPKRSIRITKSNLMRGSATGSERTLLKNLNHLKSVGLLKVKEFEGQHGGNEYEVFLPEETHPTLPTSPTPQQTRHSQYAQQKVGVVPPVGSDVSGVGQTQENKELSDGLKLNTKTINKDDERTAAFSEVIEKFDAVSRKLTGKGISKRDAEKWNDFADLIVLELEIAAKRTDAISSVPAFLTEVLRRKFFAQRQQTSTKSSKTKPDTVGKSDFESYEIKPLDNKGREDALSHLSEFAGDDFLEDFKKWYTSEDWNWMIKELEKK